MFHYQERLAIRFQVDDSKFPSDTSVSFRLIVTELVFNCLKRAFTNNRVGTIKVGFTCNGVEQVWMLEVADDGIGMLAAGERPATAGLGTSIVVLLVG